MNPSTRFAASLLASLVLWAPTMLACLRGDIDLVAAGVRYVAAFAVASVALGLLDRLVDGYAAMPSRTADATEPVTLRRSDDQLAATD